MFSLQAQPKGKSKKAKKGQEQNYLSQTYSAAEIKATDNKLEKLYALFTGHFSNKAQADTTSMAIYAEQEVIMVPIWKERVGEYWVYWAWIVANRPELTLGEGIFRFSRPQRDTFLIENYMLPNDLQGKTAMEWAKQKPLAAYSPRDLRRLNCINHAFEREPHVFEVVARECCQEYDLSNFGEVKGMALNLLMKPESFHDFSAYCNEDKQLIFEYDRPTGVYYQRMDKTKPKYQVKP